MRFIQFVQDSVEYILNTAAIQYLERTQGSSGVKCFINFTCGDQQNLSIFISEENYLDIRECLRQSEGADKVFYVITGKK